MVDAVTGTLASEHFYNGFGPRAVISETVDLGYGYTGQQYDPEMALGYFRAWRLFA